MSSASTQTAAPDPALFEAARGGDESAFARLVEPRHGELNAHCYRMLGSMHDAEDAMQETLLRAWRGLGRLEDPGALRAWLYRIATNTCLDAIGRRPKRVLPIDYAPRSDPDQAPGQPLVETVWVEPYPDETLEVEDGYSAPEARYEQREAVELAFIAALQHLPARQRAALILREVLGFSAKEVAEALETTVPSVNSALQRARQAVDEGLPEQSQQETLRTLGDEGLREVVESYIDAMGRGDVEAVVSMLTEDAAWSMPPLASWYGGIEEVEVFLRNGPLSGAWRWRHLPAHVNGQAAIGVYHLDEESGSYLPFALDVLTLEGSRIKQVTAFIVRSTDVEPEDFARWPEMPADPEMVRRVFLACGLPARID